MNGENKMPAKKFPQLKTAVARYMRADLRLIHAERDLAAATVVWEDDATWEDDEAYYVARNRRQDAKKAVRDAEKAAKKADILEEYEPTEEEFAAAVDAAAAKTGYLTNGGCLELVDYNNWYL